MMGGGGLGMPNSARANKAPLLAASDGHDLWLVHPFQFPDSDDKMAPGI